MALKIHAARPFPIAIAQLPITGSARKNAQAIKAAMREAAEGHARLVQFPEGMLSGYAKNPIMDWAEVDWQVLERELRSVMKLAAELHIWVVLGSAHRLTAPQWPHNSLYIISDTGTLVTRYDKRIVSHTEVTRFYTPGTEAIIFDVDGYRFGCLICVEINFPQLLMQYEQLGIDCLLLSAYPEAEIFYLKARAHAAIYSYWVSLSVPSQSTHLMMSSLIGPDGETLNALETDQGVVFGELDREAEAFDIALTKAKPWRAGVVADPTYNTRALNDPRSINRVAI